MNAEDNNNGRNGSCLTFSPLYRPVPPALDSPFYRPLAPALDSHSQRPQTASTTTAIADSHRLLPLNQSPTHKTMTLIWGRLRKWSQIISAHAGYFYFRVSGTNHFIFVEFRTTFFWVSTCFNGCAAATDARLGFRNSTSMVLWPWSLVKTDILRQIWLRKRRGLTSSSSWLGLPMSTVIRVTLTALLLRCPWQQRFFDIQTSANLRKFVLSFVSSISLKNRMPVIPFASERVFNSATFMPMLIPLKTLRNVSNLHLKIYSG